MTYSSAMFAKLPASWPDLADAQRCKIDRLLDAAGVGPGTQLLEIGTGWGERASARHDAERTSVRSHSRSASSGWLGNGSQPPACPIVSRSICATTATSAETTTP